MDSEQAEPFHKVNVEQVGNYTERIYRAECSDGYADSENASNDSDACLVVR